MEKHTIRWFARTTPSEEYPDGYIPRNSSMKGKDWGWDVRCSCGWESRTGGAIQEYVRGEVERHRWEVDPEGESQRSKERLEARVARWRARSDERMRSVFGPDWKRAE